MWLGSWVFSISREIVRSPQGGIEVQFLVLCKPIRWFGVLCERETLRTELLGWLGFSRSCWLWGKSLGKCKTQAMFERLFIGTILRCMLMDEPELFVTNVELWKRIRIRFKFMKIININLHGSGGTKEILIKIESEL